MQPTVINSVINGDQCEIVRAGRGERAELGAAMLRSVFLAIYDSTHNVTSESSDENLEAGSLDTRLRPRSHDAQAVAAHVARQAEIAALAFGLLFTHAFGP